MMPIELANQEPAEIPGTMIIDDLKESEELIRAEPKLVIKIMNDISSFQVYKNDIYLRGKDEDENIFQICFDSYDFLQWIDSEQLEYIKEQLTKYIKQK
tara:strand:+ start:203 stop:499 length:297 start_codon:yes stop_codon:yes gene_type:complete